MQIVELEKNKLLNWIDIDNWRDKFSQEFQIDSNSMYINLKLWKTFAIFYN